jgi:parallel beta-helix repeat protein
MSTLKNNNKSPSNTILYVGGLGIDNYTTIQEAIDISNNGDTVFVCNDSSPYNECLTISKKINVIGEDKYSTIIIGKSSESIITIKSKNVNLSGFSIRKNNSDIRVRYGIYLDNNEITIYENIIFDVDFSIYGTSYQNLIMNNQFINCGLYPTYFQFKTLLNNTVNGKPLIYLYQENNKIIKDAGQVIVIECGDVTIKNLDISNVRYAITLIHSHNCVIKHNILTDTFLHLQESKKCIISNNIINIDKNERVPTYKKCISLILSELNLIYGNTLSSSFGNGLYLIGSSENIIIRNKFSKSFNGINIEKSNLNLVKRNNFDKNVIHAHFLDCYFTRWRGNHWGRMRLPPKIIIGRITLLPQGYMNSPLYMPWINCDFFPSILPNVIL